jgi:hypothetical protein
VSGTCAWRICPSGRHLPAIGRRVVRIAFGIALTIRVAVAVPKPKSPLESPDQVRRKKETKSTSPWAAFPYGRRTSTKTRALVEFFAGARPD